MTQFENDTWAFDYSDGLTPDNEKSIVAIVGGVYTSFPCNGEHSIHLEYLKSGRTPADYVAPAVTMDIIRGERNQLLRDTDWQAGTDVTMSDAQTAYRKKLRDLPATNSDPTKIVFPDAP
jgi:hypothetical protein